MWETNARAVERVFGGEVDWDERFYICPECGEPIYEDDWDDSELFLVFCPICGFYEDEKEF